MDQANTVPRPQPVGGDIEILSRQCASDAKQRGVDNGALRGAGDTLDFPMKFHNPDEDDCGTY